MKSRGQVLSSRWLLFFTLSCAIFGQPAKPVNFDTEHCLRYYVGIWKSHQAAFQLTLGLDARYELKTGYVPGQVRVGHRISGETGTEQGSVSYEAALKPEGKPFAEAYSVIPGGALPIRQKNLEFTPIQGIPVGPTMLMHLRDDATGNIHSYLISVISYRAGIVLEPKLLILQDTTPGSEQKPVMLSTNPLDLFGELHAAFDHGKPIPDVPIDPGWLIGSWTGVRSARRLTITQDTKTAVADLSPQEDAEQKLSSCACTKSGNIEISADGAPEITWTKVQGKAHPVVGNGPIERYVDQPFVEGPRTDKLRWFILQPRVSKSGDKLIYGRSLALYGACETAGRFACDYKLDPVECVGCATRVR